MASQNLTSSGSPAAGTPSYKTLAGLMALLTVEGGTGVVADASSTSLMASAPDAIATFAPEATWTGDAGGGTAAVALAVAVVMAELAAELDASVPARAAAGLTAVSTSAFKFPRIGHGAVAPPMAVGKLAGRDALWRIAAGVGRAVEAGSVAAAFSSRATCLLTATAASSGFGAVVAVNRPGCCSPSAAGRGRVSAAARKARLAWSGGAVVFENVDEFVRTCDSETCADSPPLAIWAWGGGVPAVTLAAAGIASASWGAIATMSPEATAACPVMW